MSKLREIAKIWVRRNYAEGTKLIGADGLPIDDVDDALLRAEVLAENSSTVLPPMVWERSWNV